MVGVQLRFAAANAEVCGSSKASIAAFCLCRSAKAKRRSLSRSTKVLSQANDNTDRVHNKVRGNDDLTWFFSDRPHQEGRAHRFSLHCQGCRKVRRNFQAMERPATGIDGTVLL